jgi:hypothetical protein
MSLLLTGGVALAYAAGVVGLHRYTVHRRRVRAQHFATLKWLDWDTLLAGLLPEARQPDAPEGPTPLEGGPPVRLLQRAPSDAEAREVALLRALVSGASVGREAIEGARFSGGEARWLEVLASFRRAPRATLERLESAPANSVAEAYLREWLVLTHTATPLNLELLVFGSKRRINFALGRFGDHPALYFVRALASSLLGLTGAVLDDLARAVYFSRKAPFYLQAVLQLPFVEDARPALVRACREGLER